MAFYMPALFVIVNATKEFLKCRKASRGVNRTVTLLTSFIVAFGMMGIITFTALHASSRGWFADKGEETYEHNGMVWVIHRDELPLVVEDLLDVDFDGYVKERRGSTSLLLGQLVMRQYPRFDAANRLDIPQLEYTMTLVNISSLYGPCKDILMHDAENTHWGKEWEYRAEDAAPWGAKEAYRLHDLTYGARNDYLLCYDRLLVEITFDWEPSEAQMTLVGQKLGGALS